MFLYVRIYFYYLPFLLFRVLFFLLLIIVIDMMSEMLIK